MMLPELDILDDAAWRKQSPFSRVFGSYTICKVFVNGQAQYELWKNSAFCARAGDAATLRVIAKAGGGVA